MSNRIVGELQFPIRGDASGAIHAIDGVEKHSRVGAEKISRNLKGIGERFTQIGRQLTTFVTLPIVGLGVAMTKAASDAEETASKFDTVFSGIRKQANQTADDLSDGFGLSSTKARELIGNTGDLLTGFGFTQRAALDLSNQVSQLGVDLASFTNFSGGAEGAVDALTKALFGEREAVKALGVAIREEDVKAEIDRLVTSGELAADTAFAQARAYATLQIAIRQSKNAVGDFARTQEGFAAQSRMLREDINDLFVAFGKELLPVAKDLVGVVRELVQRFQDLDEDTKRGVLRMLGLAAAIGPASLAMGQLAKVIQTLSSSKAALVLTAIGVAAGGIAAATSAIRDKRNEKGLEVISQRLADSVKSGEDLADAIQRVARETGLTEDQVADLADAAGLVTAQYQEQIDLLREQSPEAEKSAKKIIQENRKIVRDFEAFLPLLVPEAVSRVVRDIAAGYDVSLDRAISLADQVEFLTDEQREQLSLMRDQLTEAQGIKDFWQLTAEASAAHTESLADANELAAEQLAADEQAARLAKIRAEAEERLRETTRVAQKLEQEGIIDREESLQRQVDAEEDLLETLFRAGIYYTNNKDAQNDIVQLSIAQLSALQRELDLLRPLVSMEDERNKTIDNSVKAWERMLSVRKQLAGIDKEDEDEDPFDLEAFDKFLGAAQIVASEFSGLMSRINAQQQAVIDVQFDERQRKLDDWYENQKTALEGSVEDEKERAAAIEALDQVLADKQSELDADREAREREFARESAIRTKIAAIFESIVNTLVAISSALKRGPIFAAIVGGLGAAQTAAIAATPIPSLDTGGTLLQRDQVVQAHRGETIMQPEQLAEVIRSAVAGSGAGDVIIQQPLTLQIETGPIFRGILQASRKGIVLLDEGAVVRR